MHMHRHLLGLVAHHVVVQLNLQPSGKGHYSWECTTGLVNQLSVLGHWTWTCFYQLLQSLAPFGVIATMHRSCLCHPIISRPCLWLPAAALGGSCHERKLFFLFLFFFPILSVCFFSFLSPWIAMSWPSTWHQPHDQGPLVMQFSSSAWCLAKAQRCLHLCSRWKEEYPLKVNCTTNRRKQPQPLKEANAHPRKTLGWSP